MNERNDDIQRDRLAELERYRILDTLPERAYDDIVKLAAAICDAPIALVSLVDEKRQWFKARVGIDAEQTAKEHAFCAHAIKQDELMVVADATTDQRFIDNPLVTGEPGIRFYAGAQLYSPAGFALGTLCVIDTEPRTLTEAQQLGLEALARQVMTHLDLRRAVSELETNSLARETAMDELRAFEEKLKLVIEASQAGVWDWDLTAGTVEFSEAWKNLLGFEGAEIKSYEQEWWERIHPEDRNGVEQWTQTGLAVAGQPFHHEYRMRHRDGDYRWVSVRAVAVHDDAGHPVRAAGTTLDITARRRAELEARVGQKRTQQVLDRVIALAGMMTPDGRLFEANESALAAAGAAAESPIGALFEDTFWFNYSTESVDTIRRARETAASGQKVRFDHTIRVGDGGFRVIDLSINPLFDDNGTVELLIPSAVDITKRKQAEERLYQAKELAEITLRSIGDGVIRTDANGIIDAINPVAEELTGYRDGSAVGLPITAVFNIFNEHSRQPVESPLDRCLREGVIVGLANHTILIREDGTEISIDDSAAPIRTADGEIVGAVLIFRDVTQERKLVERVKRQASYDSLTNLPNRREFEHRLQLMLDSAVNRRAEHAVCFLDLDQFKLINDTCGHSAGDALLAQLSATLSTKVRQRDTLARLGGDEFGLLLGECPLGRAVEIALDIKNAVQAFRFAWEDHVFNIGVSIGLTQVTRESGDIATIMSTADTACYMAKEKGRNQIHVHDTNDNELAAYQTEMRWVNRIQEALIENRLELYAQEIVSVRAETSQQKHLEILLRLRDQDGTVHVPGAFLPAAERYSEIGKIDRWVFEHVYDVLATNSANDVAICNVNISGASMGNSEFLDDVIKRIQSGPVDPGRLCFEITETTAISNLQAAQSFLSALRAAGCRFALDDFGSGVSSMNYLKNLAVDVIKIDGSFVRDMATDPIDHAMVEAIQRVANLMHIETVAEHVEDRATVKALRKIGIDYAQGYLFGKPRPLAEFLA